MSNIFEKLDKILMSINEAEEPEVEETAREKAERMVKAIPINPEMETAEQGKHKAWEKICKYFYELSMGGMPGSGLSRTDEMDIPDDFLDPKMKGKMSGKMSDTEFEKNKVIWDQDQEMEKLEKEIEVNMTGESDEFDDFDYRDNTFGDDADMDDVDTEDLDGGSGGGGGDSDKSEDEKLKDAIDDALDELSDSGDLDGDNGQESGQQQGGEQQGGQQQGGQQGGQEGEQEGGQQGGQQGGGQEGEQEGGQEGGQQGGQQGGNQQGGQQQSGSQDGGPQGENGDHSSKPSSTRKAMSKKDQKLKDLKDAIDRGDADEVQQNFDDVKEGSDGSGDLAGERIGEVSDKDLRGDMEKAGISQKDIDDMVKAAQEDKGKEVSEEETEELRKSVIDGLEKKCAKKGGSALAKTIVKNALKSKVNDDEWRNMLKLFLKSKAVNRGDMSKTNKGIKYGHKNHLWRDAMLPTSAPSKGQIQTIYCFIDFSGSVDQDLVYVFLGRVIDLCAELNYTNVVIYGFGERIVLPKKIDGRMIKKDGKDVVLSQTWDYIQQQHPGPCTENFRDVAHEILEIRKHQRDAVYLIFGDALWQDPEDGPMCLKYICGERLLDRMCVLTYYQSDGWWLDMYKGCISMLKELVGLKNVITTKVSHIVE